MRRHGATTPRRLEGGILGGEERLKVTRKRRRERQRRTSRSADHLDTKDKRLTGKSAQRKTGRFFKTWSNTLSGNGNSCGQTGRLSRPATPALCPSAALVAGPRGLPRWAGGVAALKWWCIGWPLSALPVLDFLTENPLKEV